MSTELKAPTDTITATRFSTRDGSGIQLNKPSARVNGVPVDSIQFSREEAVAVAQTLLAFGLGKEEEETPIQVPRRGNPNEMWEQR